MFRRCFDQESKIEVTLAEIGYQQGLEKEKLNQDGFAIVDEDFIKEEGAVIRPLKYISENPIAKLQSEVFTEWVKAFEKKNKQSGRENQSIIIGYKRIWSFDNENLLEEVKAFVEYLESQVMENQFHSIYLFRLDSSCVQDKLWAYEASDGNDLH